MALTIEQQQAIALARARRRKAEAQGQNLGTEIQANQPVPPVEGSNTPDDFMSGTGAFAEPITTQEQADSEVEKRNQRDFEHAQVGTKGFLSTPANLGKGIVNYGTHFNTVGLSLADSAVEGVTGRDSNMAGNYALNNPSFEGKTTFDKLGIGTGEAAPGLIAGSRAASGVITGLAGPVTAETSLLGKTARAGGEFVGAELGAAVGADKDSGTPVSDAFGTSTQLDPKGDFNDEHLKKSLNMAADAVITGALAGAAGGAAAKSIGYAAGVVKKIFKMADPNAMGDEMTKLIVDRFIKLPPNATHDETMAAYRDVYNMIEQGKNQTVQLGDSDVADAVVDPDTISLFLQKLNPKNPEDRAIMKSLESLRTSSLKGGSPRLETTLDRPKDEFGRVLDDIHQTRGGDDAIDQTKTAIQQSGRAEAEAAKIPSQTATQDLADANADLHNTLRSDETFGPKFREADQAGVRLNINDESLAKQTELLQKVKSQRALDKKTRDDAYHSIPDATPANMDEWNAAVEKAGDLPEEIQSAINNADGSFKYLNNEVRPKLSAAITNEYQAKIPDMNKINRLKGLRDNITDDQVAYLTEHGNEQTIAAAKNANKANIDYSADYNQGVGKELRINEMVNRPKTQPIDFIEKGRTVILKTIKDPNRKESMTQLFKIAKPENEGLIGDIALAESLKDITADNADIGKITTSLQQMSNAFPERQKLRIEGFLTDVRDKKKGIDYLKNKVVELEKESSLAQARIYSDHLGDFFKKNSAGEWDDLPNGNAIFEKLLKDPQAGTKLDDIITRIDSDPAAKKGLQAAWAESAKNTTLSNNVDIPEMQKHLVDYGNKIFKDTPLVVPALLELNQRAGTIATASKARQAGGLDFSKYKTEGTYGINQALTMVFGILNPTAAKIRTVSSDLLRTYDPTDKARVVADGILANADEFNKVLERIIAKKSTQLSGQDKKDLFRIFFRTGYTASDQTNDALNQ